MNLSRRQKHPTNRSSRTVKSVVGFAKGAKPTPLLPARWALPLAETYEKNNLLFQIMVYNFNCHVRYFSIYRRSVGRCPDYTTNTLETICSRSICSDVWCPYIIIIKTKSCCNTRKITIRCKILLHNNRYECSRSNSFYCQRTYIIVTSIKCS